MSIFNLHSSVVEDYRAGFFNPLFGCEDKAVQTGLHSNPVEFDGIKTRVVEPFPVVVIDVKFKLAKILVVEFAHFQIQHEAGC